MYPVPPNDPYENVHKWQHYVMNFAHRGQYAKYKVRVLYDDVKQKWAKYTCAIIFSEKIPFGAIYLSTDDFIERKEHPLYRLGAFRMDESGKPYFQEVFALEDITLDPKLFDYIDRIASVVTVPDEEKAKVIKLLRTPTPFIEWAKSVGMRPFIRQRRKDITSTEYYGTLDY
jgi:hypothetical protein